MSEPLPSLDGLRIKREPRPASRGAWWVILLLVVAFVVIGGAISWYNRSRPIEVSTAVAEAVKSAGLGVNRTVLNASGYVTARREATVSSKVTGKVDEILIEEGMKVTEGQVLARLDGSNVDANLQHARAQADAARSAVAETLVRLKEAEQELQRQSDLRNRQVNAQSDLDHAEAAVLAFRARIEQQQAEARVAARTVAVWERQLEDTIIKAPFGGTVTSKNAQPGEMISPMSTGGFTRTGICTIVDMESLEIEIDVNESYINRVAPGQPVEATLDAYPDWKIPCHVIAIIPTADRNKSTVRVRVAFDKLDTRILPDMSVKVAFREAAGAAGTANGSGGVMVPTAAVFKEGSSAIVMVIRDGRAERRVVSTAGTESDRVIVSSGVGAGERVVVSPPKQLSEGTRVKEIKP